MNQIGYIGFNKEELEVLELICCDARANIVECANDDRWHSEEFMDLCVNNERITSGIIEKVRKM